MEDLHLKVILALTDPPPAEQDRLLSAEDRQLVEDLARAIPKQQAEDSHGH